MNRILNILLIVLVGLGGLIMGCKRSPEKNKEAKIIQTDNGIYTLIRPRTELSDGSFLIEIWAKEGVNTNNYVYRREVWNNGESRFFRMEPIW